MQALFEELQSAGIDFYASVPCSLLSGLLELVSRDPGAHHVPVTREEEGLGVLSGAWLAGKRPALLLQNSGLGNLVNALCSLVGHYRIPITFIVSHRGSEGESIPAQVPMGRISRQLLELAQVECHEIHSRSELACLRPAIELARRECRPVAFLFPFSFWQEQA